MALVEIDETELVNMRQIAGSVQKMLANPTARKKLLEAQKTIKPDAVIPELDTENTIQTALSETNKKLDAMAKQREEDKENDAKEKTMAKLTAEWEAGRSKARAAGYTVEGLQSLEKFMEDKGVADFDVAMAAFEKLNPPEAPVASSGGRFDVFQKINDGGDVMKSLLDSHGQDPQAVGKLINAALSDVRTGGR